MRRLYPTRAFLALVVTLSVVVPAGAALTGCPYAREAALRSTVVVSDPVDCVPDTYACVAGVPVVCSRATVPGSTRHRQWPTLPRDALGSQRACAGGCVVDADSGIAHCVPVDASTDGGAL